MGLFDRALRKGLNKVLSGVGEEAAKAVTDAVKNVAGRSSRFDDARNDAPRAAQPTYTPTDIVETMPEILAASFSEYEVQREVPASAFGWDASPARPYSYCLYRDGYLAAAIMLTPHNRDSNMAFKNAKAACRDNGIPFINFYTHMPNDRQYVEGRIRSFLA